jgi:dUTP pyrophosphatase
VNANLRNFGLWIIIGLVLIALFNLFQNTGQRTAGRDFAYVVYSQFLTDVNSGKVRNVTMAGHQITGTYSDMTTFQTYSPDDPRLVQTLQERNVQITARPSTEGETSVSDRLISWFPMVLLLAVLIFFMILAVWIFFMRQMMGTGGKALGLAKSNAKSPTEAHARVTFDVVVRVLRLPHAAGLPLPSPASAIAAGLDLSAAVTETLLLVPGTRATIPTGFALALPEGTEAQVRPRSGLAAEHGVTVLNAPGTIDADYRGEVKVVLINLGSVPFTISRGMRIAQLVVAPVLRVTLTEVSSLDNTGRGAGGFGSTGLSD